MSRSLDISTLRKSLSNRHKLNYEVRMGLFYLSIISLNLSNRMATFDILFPMGQTKFTLNIYLSIIYFKTRHKVSDIDQNAQ